MPGVEDEVPQWKKELIQKKQMWKTSGGWSVPPVTSKSTSKTSLKIRPPDFKAPNTDRVPNSGSTTPNLDVDTNNNRTAGFTGSVENVNFGSVSELKSIFSGQNDEFAPLTKARSEENILDGPILDVRRRSSTQFSGYDQKPTLRNFKTVPKMDDFFKKYRKNTKKTVVVENADFSPRPVEKPRRKRSETVFFADMNQNELPAPNTVKQTVKVFEEPVKNGTKPDFDEVFRPDDSPRARDVVRKFEAKIKSSSAPTKPPRARTNGLGPGPNPRTNGLGPGPNPRKPAISTSSSRKESGKHVSFSDVADEPATLIVENDGTTNLDSIRDDLKTVTINTNKSIIIKTV
ncbi:hypothetical protein GE061_012862 [Apolygus lucorum]|uniref:Uncharacterized protein n=1 Tax=Apolygus lucorum TaxID=248454 RepID=A0A8S9XTI2_APOLU|nr:hypothetical protein GE061_012862 [Apolygus lucorum]